MPSKVWENLTVGFAPYRPYPFFRRLAPWPFLWLGCWSVDCTLSLDTANRLYEMPHFDDSTKVLNLISQSYPAGGECGGSNVERGYSRRFYRDQGSNVPIALATLSA